MHPLETVCEGSVPGVGGVATFFLADFVLRTCCAAYFPLCENTMELLRSHSIALLCADNTGEITRDEVVSHIVDEVAGSDLELEVGEIRKSTEHLIRVVDTNRTNTIDFEEFVE